MLRSDLQGIMSEVISVIVTNVSVIINEEHTKQAVSPLLRERHVHVTFQQCMVLDQLLS